MVFLAIFFYINNAFVAKKHRTADLPMYQNCTLQQRSKREREQENKLINLCVYVCMCFYVHPLKPSSTYTQTHTGNSPPSPSPSPPPHLHTNHCEKFDLYERSRDFCPKSIEVIVFLWYFWVYSLVMNGKGCRAVNWTVFIDGY